MKTNIVWFLTSVIFAFVVYANGYSQGLSEMGRRHFRTGEEIAKNASRVSEYKVAIEEFESVLKTDPQFADTYFNLGMLCRSVGKEEGEPYLHKAEEYYKKYQTLKPEDSALINDELYLLKRYKDIYLLSDKCSIVGNWRATTGIWYVPDNSEYDYHGSVGIHELEISIKRNNVLDGSNYDISVKCTDVDTGIWYYWDKSRMSIVNSSDNSIQFIYDTGIIRENDSTNYALDYSTGKQRRVYFSYGRIIFGYTIINTDGNVSLIENSYHIFCYDSNKKLIFDRNNDYSSVRTMRMERIY